MSAPIHLISKVADPFFAAFIGLSAATLRINREEKEKGQSIQQTVNSALRRIGLPRANDPLAKRN